MIKYTFIFEYKGGTYIKQVVATSLNEAIDAWAELVGPEIPKFGKKRKKRLFEQMKHDRPIPLDGLENIWCMSFLMGKASGLLNIVATI